MEELIKTLSNIKPEEIIEMLEIYDKLPEGIIKDSMRISLTNIANIRKKIYEEKHTKN